MKKDVIVSVIIPMHNAEKHLEECLNSIVNQTLRDIEIICVNDGSTDGTERIVRRYMEIDERIAIINQKNQYAGVARNNGMEMSQGEYVVFWDADDVFEVDALEKMYTQIIQDDADICLCNAVQMHSESGTLVKKGYLKMAYMPKQIPFSIKEVPEYIFNCTTNVPWNKMFKSEFVKKNNLEFQESIRANDQYFVLMALALAERITVVFESLVRYRINNSSSLTENLSDTPLCTFEALKKTHDKLEELGLLENSRIQQSFANKAFNSLHYNLCKQTSLEAFMQIFNLLKSTGLSCLGLENREEGYFYSSTSYKNYRKIVDLDITQYLFIDAMEIRIKSDNQRFEISEIKNEKNNVKKEVKDVKKEIKALKQELNAIKKSRVYKILVWIRKLIPGK